MKRPDMLKLAKERGITGAFNMKNPELEEALGLNKAITEKVKEKVYKEPDKVLYKANENSNIEGFWFNPFLLIDKTAMVLRKGKYVNAVEFLESSGWFRRKFFRVGDKSFVDQTPQKATYTKDDLLKMASDQNIPVNSKMDELDLYIAIFGGEKQDGKEAI